MKLSEAFDLYKTEYLLIKKLSRRVLENNDYIKRSLINYVGDIDISELTLADIAGWIESLRSRSLPNGRELERCPGTIRNYLVRLKQVIKYARLRGFGCINHELIPIPDRGDTIRPFLTPEEISLMIDNAYNIRNKFVISLLYSSGIRLSEMISLDIGSIQNRRFTVVGKGSKARLCFIDSRTEELMSQYISSRKDNCRALIISAIYKERISPTNVQLLVKNSAKRAGITKNVTPHVLRHSFATDFIANGGSIRALSSLLGHSNVSTTMVYTHIVDQDLEKYYLMYHSCDTVKR